MVSNEAEHVFVAVFGVLLLHERRKLRRKHSETFMSRHSTELRDVLSARSRRKSPYASTFDMNFVAS